MPDTDEAKTQPVPDWAVKILQSTIRDYRYTGDYLPGTDTDRVLLGVRRADRPIGSVVVTHIQQGPKHSIRLVFQPEKSKTSEELSAHSLKQLQVMAPLLMERICRYGCSLDRRWCENCSQAERHQQGVFRAPAAPPSTGSPSVGPTS